MDGLEKNRYNLLIRRFSPRNWQFFFTDVEVNLQTNGTDWFGCGREVERC